MSSVPAPWLPEIDLGADPLLGFPVVVVVVPLALLFWFSPAESIVNGGKQRGHFRGTGGTTPPSLYGGKWLPTIRERTRAMSEPRKFFGIRFLFVYWKSFMRTNKWT
jgi:hypothetical protein